jgi:hypothetical protein
MKLPKLSKGILHWQPLLDFNLISQLGEAILPSGGGSPNPPPGCWLVGTQCRGTFQSCKYCCGDGRSYTESCGWCVGWYDAPPCY